jgi:hypothetical protein
MNERIEKLGEQADLLGEFTPTKIPGRYVGYITEEQILKFAELIVRECVEIADEYDGCGSTIVSRIEKHFGVAE